MLLIEESLVARALESCRHCEGNSACLEILEVYFPAARYVAEISILSLRVDNDFLFCGRVQIWIV